MNHREKLAYLAGIIDGEGSICLWMNKSAQKRGQFNLRINVSSTDKCLIEWIVLNFGGYLYEVNAPSRKKNPQWKKQYMWQVARKELIPLMKEIYEFLIIKKDHCKIAIAFRETFDKRERNLSQETFDARIQFYKQMQLINSRGS